MRKFLFMGLLLFGAKQAFASLRDPSLVKIASLVSHEGHFSVVEYKKPPLDFPSENEIWIEPDDAKDTPQLLFRHTNRASILISENGRSIAIDYHEGSGDGLLYVYSRQGSGEFKASGGEIRDRAKPLLVKLLKSEEPKRFDHFYCHSDAWITERYLLAHLQGNNSGVSWLDPWYFVYDVQSGTIARNLDLNQVNQSVLMMLNPK